MLHTVGLRCSRGVRRLHLAGSKQACSLSQRDTLPYASRLLAANNPRSSLGNSSQDFAGGTAGKMGRSQKGLRGSAPHPPASTRLGAAWEDWTHVCEGLSTVLRKGPLLPLGVAIWTRGRRGRSCVSLCVKKRRKVIQQRFIDCFYVPGIGDIAVNRSKLRSPRCSHPTTGRQQIHQQGPLPRALQMGQRLGADQGLFCPEAHHDTMYVATVAV